ncbi:MAG: V-type ATP synthase subunit D, partial [Treponema sp.]|nr:V-type ATP synthase subunit D [Treponema sp.]
DFDIVKKASVVAGMSFTTLDVNLPEKKLFSSVMGTFPDSDQVMSDFFELLSLLTQMASIRTIAWRLAVEVRKTQRRVNALDKMVIPQDKETVKYIESVLEERERDNIFVLKSLKNRKAK